MEAALEALRPAGKKIVVVFKAKKVVQRDEYIPSMWLSKAQ